jgi:hypothetical protein
MSDMPKIQMVGSGPPRLNDGDLPGYKAKPALFPPGTPKSPYVKDRQGMVYFYEPWMDDMGDVLQPCWEAPPKPAPRVVLSPMDIEHYGKQAPQPTEQPPQTKAQTPSFASVETQNL